MTKATRMLAFLAAAALSGGVWAHEGYNGLTYSISDEIRPGEMTTRFIKAKEYADANKVPMLVFWGSSGCGVCNGLEKDISGRPDFYEWLAKRKYIMTFNVDKSDKTEYGLYKEDSLASRDLALNKKNGKWPFIAIYWPAEGGKPACWEEYQQSDGVVRFPGRSDYMPYRSEADRKGGKVDQLMRNMDYFCSVYSAYDGGEFTSSDTEYDRYECEKGTETVAVELVREKADSEAQNKLVVEYPDGSCVTNVVNWAVGDSNKVVSVDVTVGGLPKAGQQVTLVLKAIDGSVHATNHITCVEKENSAANPLWKTERRDPQANGLAPELGFGEWTADLEAANHLAERDGGYVLVSVQGSLWCPDCANTDRNFLDVKDASGANKFRAWATEHKVALVSMDVPNYNAAGPTPETVASPTIFSKKAFKTTLARPKEYPQSGADPALTNAYLRSGLGYLSRKGVPDAEAAEAMAKFRELAVTNTDKGGFHRPEDSNKYRTGVPIFVLLRKDGSVAARFTGFASVSPMAADQANFDSYVKRFEEMLAIAGEGEHADPTEIANNYPGAGALPLKANGGVATNELSHVDARDTFRLADFGGSALQKTTVRGESDANVKVTLWQIVDGTAKVVTIDGVQALAKGTLADGVTLERELPSGEYYVDVQSNGGDAFSPTSATPANFTAYEIRSEIVLKPSETVAKATAPEGTNAVSVVLESGATYRIVGLDYLSEANSNALEWVTGGDGLLFEAKAGGAVELFLSKDGGEITYQKWNPGTVGFEPVGGKAEVTVKETDEVSVVYRRAGGPSGAVTVRVSLNVEETDFFYDYAPDAGWTTKELPRFCINGVSTNEWFETVEWPDDGCPLEACASNILVTAGEFESQLISQYFGPGKVVFDLEIVSQTEAGVVTNTVDYGRFTINFEENQTPSAGRVQIAKCDREWAKPLTVYAREDEAVEVVLARIDAAEGPVSADFEKSVESVVLGGDYDLGVTWKNKDMLPKTVTVTNLPPAGESVKLTLTAESPLKVDSSAKSVTIVSVAADAPAFEWAMASNTIYRFVAVSNAYKVVGTKGGELKFTKVSGKLPKGLKAEWNGDTANPELVIAGVPTGKDGEESSAVFQVTETRGKTKVPGLTIALDFRLVDPAVSGGPGGEPLNASCAESRTFKDLMILREGEGGTAELFGTLQLTLPPTGKASAKLLCDAGKVSFSAKSWSGIDSEDFSYFCRLVGKSDYDDWALDVEAATNGEVRVMLVADDEPMLEVEHDGVLWSKDHPATDCAGYYTVTFGVNRFEDGSADVKGDYAPEGSAYLTLTMKDAQAKSGTMKWAGLLPNGTKVSGSSVLTEKGGSVFLPFVKSAKKDVFAGVLEIDREAAKRKEEEVCWESVSCPMTDDTTPVLTRWTHSEKSTKTEKGDFTVRFKPYGGIYDSTLDLGCCCEEHRATSVMTLSVSLPKLGSDFYGEFAEVSPIEVEVEDTTITRKTAFGGDNEITLKFNRKTGVISGKFDLYCDSAAKPVSATYQGVVQLGFGNACGCSDQQLPFVSGFWYVKDKIETDKGSGSYISVNRGGQVTIDGPAAD